MCDVHLDNNHTPLEAKDHLEIVLNSNDDISSNDDDSLHKENIEYVEASPHDSELVSLEAAEIVIPKVEEIKDDNLREKLLNVHLLIASIEALKDNPTQSFEPLTKSSSTSLNSFLEETNTFHNSLPEFENFYFDLGEISSGSTTTHSDISLSEYDSFIFDLTHEEFVDELAHIISPPEYDRSYFKDLPDPSELMSVLNSEIRENLFTTRVNLPIMDDHSPLLAYVVWIFLAYLTYPVIPPYLHPFGNEDTIFDPGITINHFYSFKPGLSHRHGAFKKFNTRRSHLNEWPMIINEKNIPILDSREIGILSCLGPYFIALREDTQHLSMGDFGNGYSRNEQKPGKKRQNQTQNGKDRKRRSKSKPKDKSQTFGQQKSTLKVKVNPGNVKVNPDKNQIRKSEEGIFISQDKYVAEILKKFDFSSVKIASTPIETQKPLVKYEVVADVDVHLYRSMIGSLMYLMDFRPNIMFAVYACSRFQVTPKLLHLQAVKRIFRYLKGQPKLGLWYLRDSPFDLEAYSDSDYIGANLDRKSTTGGCQFLCKRLISWQCKKQTIIATSTTEAEYVDAAHCCG
nr:uncharacterized mitochondrial protein AtMg00810-like [Tanacetum cinerariifolium]